ncbi:unnamed protein product [Coregonus sp. 'balchen']|nr:unnamed protein product [Coregonus sp. 'balchen']
MNNTLRKDSKKDCCFEISASDKRVYHPSPPKPKVEPPTPHSKPSPPTKATVNKITDYQNYYQGIWDCTGDQPDELSFRRGDAIYILSKEYQSYGWWIGEMKGSVGIVPKEYLMELYAI